MQRWCRY